MSLTIDDVRDAAGRIARWIESTPCAHSAALSALTGCNVYCKLDYLQCTGSFKDRGACNALLTLDEAARKRGVIAASAGNHALALAYFGGKLGVPVTVIMPEFAPLTKVVNCKRFGATVIQHGQSIADAAEHARGLVESQGLTYINGFDDAAIIAGQGTMGLEILEQAPTVEVIVVPVGGAGLIAGVSLAVKTLRPQVRVIGVEPMRVASLTAAMEKGEPVRIDAQATLADGLAVPRVGDRAFAIARQYVDRVVTVDEHFIAQAVLRLAEMEKAVVEGAGAAGLAAMLAGALPELRGKTVVLPLCGGNIDMPVLGQLIDRGLAADGRLCRFEARISDRPGGLARFAAAVAEAGASVRQITHDRAFAGDDLNEVMVHCIVETRDAAHIQQLRERLAAAGFAVAFDPGHAFDTPPA